MNRAAQRLGMTQTTYVNPNGLPADGQVTSARDLAILARAMIRELPEYDSYWHIPAIKFGKRVMRNYNNLIGRYAGTDGMKTGFICASGFNLVASATRDGKRFIAVVLGARSSAQRAERAAQLLEKGFSGGSGLSWLMPALGRVEGIAPVKVDPPNLRDEMCGKHRRRPAAENSEEDEAEDSGAESIWTLLNPGLDKNSKGAPLLGPLVVAGPPVAVFVGPAKNATAVARAKDNNTYRTAAAPTEAPTPPTADAVPADPVPNGFGELTKILSATKFVPNPATLALTSSAEAAGAPVVRLESLVPLPRPRPKRPVRPAPPAAAAAVPSR
jgi:D-alanyl-D-alanine carboxypeptidase